MRMGGGEPMTNEAVSQNLWFSRRSIFLLLLIIVFAFGGGLLAAPHLVGWASSTATVQAATPPLAGEAVVVAYSEALAQVYEKVLPSVVRVEVIGGSQPLAETEAGSLATPVSPQPVSPSKGQGSGFVWDKAGHIVTNLHVAQGADQIEVIFAAGTRAEANLLGIDLSTDLAVLKINLPPDRLHPVTLGDSAGLKVGQLTLTMGAPFGQEFTMTSGIVSVVGRSMKSCDSCYPIAEAIQMDTPINPGNSGGPLPQRLRLHTWQRW